jgi:hypothetical protein
MSQINGETIERQIQRRVNHIIDIMSVEALRYTAKDCLDAILNNPTCDMAQVWHAELNACLNRLNELGRR